LTRGFDIEPFEMFCSNIFDAISFLIEYKHLTEGRAVTNPVRSLCKYASHAELWNKTLRN